MAYATNTSRKIPAGTQNTHTYGASGEGKDYSPGVNGGVMGWFTHVAASTNVEFLDLYRAAGQSLSLYDDYIHDIPAQSGPRIIRPAGIPGEASWQGHNGTPLSGVGFAPSIGDTYHAYEIDQTNIRIYDLIMKGVSDKRMIGCFASLTGTLHFIGNIFLRVGTTPTSASQNMLDNSSEATTYYFINNIVVGFYQGFRGECSSNSVFANNTYIDMVSSPLYYNSAAGLQHDAWCINNAYYNCPVASVYPPNKDITNVTLNSSTDLADYAGQDYRLSATASEALGQGTGMASNAYYSFADDLLNANVTSWNIGAGANLSVEYHLNATSSWHLIAALTATSSWNIYGSVAISTNFTEYYRKSIFDAIFGIAAFTPVPPYLALADDASSEPVGGGYIRPLITPWGPPSSGSVSNSSTVRFPRASGDWGLMSRFLLSDSMASGNTLGAGQLTVPVQITGSESGGLFAFFQAGEIELSLTGNIFHGFSGAVLSALTNGTPVPTGSIRIGLTTGSAPTREGVYTEVSATGYSRAQTIFSYSDGLYSNDSNAQFPVVQSGHDWGTITGFVIFINGAPFAFGSIAATVVDYTNYGSSGYVVPAETIVVEVV